MNHLSFSYVRFSNIAAQCVRSALKNTPELKEAAAKREISSIKFQKWEGGKPVGK